MVPRGCRMKMILARWRRQRQSVLFPLRQKSAFRQQEALCCYQGGRLYTKYGFLDSFNPSFRDTQAHVEVGQVDKNLGWVDSDYLGVDQGPILGMIANYKTGIIWNATCKATNLVRGLRRAGFTGGWLDKARLG